MIGSPFLFFDSYCDEGSAGPLEKPLLSRRRSIGEPFLLVKGKFASEGSALDKALFVI
jgi:hypothetical protein